MRRCLVSLVGHLHVGTLSACHLYVTACLEALAPSASPICFHRVIALMSKTPHIFVFPTSKAAHVPTSLYGEEEKRWKTLARVVAENVRQNSSNRTAVVLRPDAKPTLAVAGWFTPSEAAHVRTAIPWFVDTLSRLRYADYSQVEADCIRLGETLREHLSNKTLQNASFVSIPRGGTVVLGLLSYVLDLDHCQIDPRDLTTGPLVVVDDCFLSGARLARFLNKHPSPSDVVVAGLYAHPDLRMAVEREQPRVHTCMTARDLTDHAPAIYGDDYEAWKTRWKHREGGLRYWTGITEHLCFPWGEPDYKFWNAEAETIDRAWTVAPPEQCLQTQFGASTSPGRAVQVQHSASGAIQVSPEVFYASFTDRVLIRGVESDECLELDGTAADFWTALVTSETVSEARASLQQKYDVEPECLASDLRLFVDTLIDRRVLKEESTDALAI